MSRKIVCGQRWVQGTNGPVVEVCAIIDRGKGGWELVTGYYDPNQGQTVDSIPDESWWNRGRTSVSPLWALIGWAESELVSWSVEAAGPDLAGLLRDIRRQHDDMYRAVRQHIEGSDRGR